MCMGEDAALRVHLENNSLGRLPRKRLSVTRGEDSSGEKKNKEKIRKVKKTRTSKKENEQQSNQKDQKSWRCFKLLIKGME